MRDDCDTVLAHKKQEWIGYTLSKNFKVPEVRDAVCGASSDSPSPMQYRLHDPEANPPKWVPRTLLDREFVLRHFTGVPKFVAIIRMDVPNVAGVHWYVTAGLNFSDAFKVLNGVLVSCIVSPLLAIGLLAVSNRLLRKNIRLRILTFASLAREVANGRQEVHADTAVADEIQDALRQVLLLIKPQSTFVAIHNPYIAGNPVISPRMFFGRDADLKWIAYRLSSSNCMVGIYGPRRIGKASLLQHVSRNEFDSRLYPVFVDTQDMIPAIVNDAKFYDYLQDRLIHALAESGARRRAGQRSI